MDEERGAWIADAQARHAAAEALLSQSVRPPSRMASEQIGALVAALGDIVDVLRKADPNGKAEIYGRLGLRLDIPAAQQEVRW